MNALASRYARLKSPPTLAGATPRNSSVGAGSQPADVQTDVYRSRSAEPWETNIPAPAGGPLAESSTSKVVTSVLAAGALALIGTVGAAAIAAAGLPGGLAVATAFAGGGATLLHAKDRGMTGSGFNKVVAGLLCAGAAYLGVGASHFFLGANLIPHLLTGALGGAMAFAGLDSLFSPKGSE